MRNLLLVDDEVNILRALKRQLISLDKTSYNIYTAESGLEGLELLKSKKIQVILSDQRMPHMNGTEFLNQVKVLYPTTVRMILSGYADFNSVQEAINSGNVFRFLNKPWKTDELICHIEDAFAQYDVQKQQFHAHRAMTQASESVMITDSDFNIISVNKTFCLTTEYSEEEVIGIFVDLIDREQITSEELAEIYEYIHVKGIWQGNLWFKKKSGTKFLVFLSISSIYDENGVVENFVYSFV